MKLLVLLVLVVSLFNGYLASIVNSSGLSAGILCGYCNSVVKNIQELLDAGVSDLDGYVGELCEPFGVIGLSKKCEKILESELDKIVQDAGELDTLCSTFGMCMAPSESILESSSSSSSSSSVPSSIKCVICKFLAQSVEAYLERNSTQNQIEYYLDKDCERFGEYASPCTVYVNEYVPILVNHMGNHEKPTQVCEEIKLC